MKLILLLITNTLNPDDSIQRAAELLGDGAFHALPVVDPQGSLVGILTSTDLVRLLHAELRGRP